jgi:hypothetical protein
LIFPICRKTKSRRGRELSSSRLLSHTRPRLGSSTGQLSPCAHKYRRQRQLEIFPPPSIYGTVIPPMSAQPSSGFRTTHFFRPALRTSRWLGQKHPQSTCIPPCAHPRTSLLHPALLSPLSAGARPPSLPSDSPDPSFMISAHHARSDKIFT